MGVERAEEHPTFDIGGNAVTSLAAPSRGSHEAALYRIDLQPEGQLPPHRHDHLDVFTVTAGDATFHLDGEELPMAVGDSAVVPVGSLHWLVAGAGGASIVTTMHPGTKLIREDDGEESVPPWVA